MTKPAPSTESLPVAVQEYDFLAGFLSYLIPGLGQIYQGRVGKGVLFLVCVLGLFFTGMALGNWKNVYLPDANRLPRATLSLRVLPPIEMDGIGKAFYYRLQYLGQFWMGVAAWPALWQYMTFDENKESGPLIGNFQRAPSEKVLNDIQSNGDKRWDLGWVYTVIAGVLNILVIYDAFAGPFYAVKPASDRPLTEANPA